MSIENTQWYLFILNKKPHLIKKSETRTILEEYNHLKNNFWQTNYFFL